MDFQAYVCMYVRFFWHKPKNTTKILQYSVWEPLTYTTLYYTTYFCLVPSQVKQVTIVCILFDVYYYTEVIINRLKETC